MKINTWEHFIIEAFSSFKHNRLMSLAAVSTMALSLLILGIFVILLLNLNHIVSSLESQVQISVYMQDGLSDSEMRECGTKIARLNGVKQVIFVNKEDALVKFRDRLGDQQSILEALGESNPLPNYFEVRVDAPERVTATATSIEQFKGVDKVRYGQEVIENLFKLTYVVRIVGVVLIVFLALSALFIISNTIRITVFARRKEIGIMKYVGATDWFIRWPFLIEGLILGGVGATIAVLILNYAYGFVISQIYDIVAFLPLIPQYPFLGWLSAMIIFCGIGIGALGSTISLKRLMDV